MSKLELLKYIYYQLGGDKLYEHNEKVGILISNIPKL